MWCVPEVTDATDAADALKRQKSRWNHNSQRVTKFNLQVSKQWAKPDTMHLGCVGNSLCIISSTGLRTFSHATLRDAMTNHVWLVYRQSSNIRIVRIIRISRTYSCYILIYGIFDIFDLFDLFFIWLIWLLRKKCWIQTLTIPGVPASTTGCTIPASHGAVADQGTCQPELSENRTETHVSRYLVARDPCLCVWASCCCISGQERQPKIVQEVSCWDPRQL